MKAYRLDNGQNRVIFVREGTNVPMGEALETVRTEGYEAAASYHFEQNPTVKLVIVEWGKVIFASE